MQELELDLNKDAIQATIDICLHLTYLRNLTGDKLGPLQIVISVVSDGLALAIPYQIISNKTYKNTSKIDLESYSSPLYVLQAFENSILDEVVIFKIHVPIDHVETGNLKVVIGLDTVNEMSFDNQDTSKRLSQVEFNFNSILYIDSFLPCTFKSYGISLEGNIFTHLLGCKYANFNNIYRHHFYQAIDHLVICYNKLREKTNFLIRKSETLQISTQYVEDLPLYIDMKKYEEYEQIKGFIEKRIFQQQTMKEHRVILQKFVEKFVPQMTQKLLIVWKLFLKLVNFNMAEQFRDQFYEKLRIELKKRIEYREVQNYKPISQIQKKTSAIQENSPTTASSSITRAEFNEIYSFTENQVAQNDLKERFDDKNIYHYLKKLYISNLQFPYPSVKIRVNKSIKQKSKQEIPFASEPHVIVFVHGLGATSNAFSDFESSVKNLYWKNVYVLNSVCNESFVNEEMEEMGRKLAIEVTQFIIQNGFGQNFQLSFVGHSLGGLIIRSALPKLQNYKFNMKSLITLSSPHLGYFYHNSTLNKAGMWAISKFSNNQIMNNLLMSDSKDAQVNEETCYRNSYLYLLSLNQGMNWFEHVMFCGSMDDYFVSPLSAFATTRESIQMKKDIKSKIWEEMRVNIEANLTNCNIYRLMVEFGEKSEASIKDQLIGRASHIMYLSSQDFISYVLLVYKDLFA